MPTQVQLASDDFNRANEVPLAGNWTPFSGAPILSSNHIEDANPGDGIDASAYYNAVVWPADQWSQITALSLGNNSVGPQARVNVPLAPTTGSLYFMYGNGATLILAKFVNGTNNYTEINTTTYTLTAGDVMLIYAIGTSIQGFINGTLKVQATDASIASGFAGISCLDLGGGTSGQIDNWSGGTFTSTPVTRSTASDRQPATGRQSASNRVAATGRLNV